MNTHKLKPNDYSYGIKLLKTNYILRPIESMYNAKNTSKSK